MPIKISYETSASSKERWEYWLQEDNSSVYRTPLSVRDLNDINNFVKYMSISISSNPDDFDRTNFISEVFEEQNFEIYKEMSDFTHFYFLFEYSPDSPLQMDEMSEIMMRFFKLVIANNSEPKYYFFAAESRNKIVNSLCIEILAGKL